MHTLTIIACFSFISSVLGIAIPTTAPSTAVTVDKALLSVSLEFFTFPDYSALTSTTNCLANLATLRGSPPAVRIGGTTQDRATYDASLTTAVNYTVASPLDAPDTLTYGPTFFTLAAKMKGDVTIGLNRRLDNQANTLAAAIQAKKSMPNLLSIELGKEPEFYAAGSPIIPATGWTPAADGASQKSWFTALAPHLRFATSFVYLQPPKWSTAGLVPMLGSAISFVKTVSGHSFIPTISVWGCWHQFGVFDELFYTKQYSVEAAAAHNAGARYFLGETNSATCGGGGISPTFGAALWIVEYALQAALNGVERLYFHQGTIANCQYCWWGRFTVGAPYYGAAFVSEFLRTDGQRLVMLDDGTGTLASYAVYNAAGHPVRLLIYNSAFFDGTGTRSSTSVSFTGGSLPASGTKAAKRLTTPNATSRVDQGAAVTIGGAGVFSSRCTNMGTQAFEAVVVAGGTLQVSVDASEALIVFL